MLYGTLHAYILLVKHRAGVKRKWFLELENKRKSFRKKEENSNVSSYSLYPVCFSPSIPLSTYSNLMMLMMKALLEKKGRKSRLSFAGKCFAFFGQLSGICTWKEYFFLLCTMKGAGKKRMGLRIVHRIFGAPAAPVPKKRLIFK